MGSLYQFELDKISGHFLVYKDASETPLVTVPYFAYGDPFVTIDDNFSVACCGSNFMDIIYNAVDYTTLSSHKFDFSGIFDSVLVGTYFDLGIWDSSYVFDLFWVFKNISGTYENLNVTYLSFDDITAIALGADYVDTVSSPATCDLTSLTPEFDEIDLQVATLHSKIDSLHQKADYLVTVLGQVYTLEQTLATKTDLQSITIDTSTLATKDDISVLSHYDVTNINLPSLNGNGAEFLDNASVTILGRETIYTVERSYMSLYTDNGYTVHYDLVSADGYKCSVPEALLTKHVTAV